MKFAFVRREEEKGLQWRFETDDRKHNLSIICHHYSYGGDNGQFETMCSWLPDVQGRLTFKQVAHKIDTIYRLEKKQKQEEKWKAERLPSGRIAVVLSEEKKQKEAKEEKPEYTDKLNVSKRTRKR